jgi:hypothetical protein
LVGSIYGRSSIICVTESHLDTNIIDNDILIDGFSDQILRKDRKSMMSKRKNMEYLLSNDE